MIYIFTIFIIYFIIIIIYLLTPDKDNFVVVVVVESTCVSLFLAFRSISEYCPRSAVAVSLSQC